MEFTAKPVINKKNFQISVCLPKKKLSKELMNEIKSKKLVSITVNKLLS